jgi:hypothetical protein
MLRGEFFIVAGLFLILAFLTIGMLIMIIVIMPILRLAAG